MNDLTEQEKAYRVHKDFEFYSRVYEQAIRAGQSIIQADASAECAVEQRSQRFPKIKMFNKYQ